MNKDDNILYERYLAQINREDSLINSRLSWFLTSQGLFIAILSINSDVSKMIEFPFFFIVFWLWFLKILLNNIIYIYLLKVLTQH